VRNIITIILLSLLWIPGALAGQFEDIRNSMIIIDTEAGRRSGILVKLDGADYVLTSQDAFTGNLLSMKTLSGKVIEALMFEVPEEPVGLLRIKTGPNMEKEIPMDDRRGDAEVYRTDPKMGVISEQAVNIGDNCWLNFPDENGFKTPFLEETIGSPVFSRDGKLIGISGINGYSTQNCGWIWVDTVSGLSGRRNELQPLKQVQKWKKTDMPQLYRQEAMLDDAENFLYPFSVVADNWLKNCYGIIAVKPEQPDKMKTWIDAQNNMVKVIPVNRIKIQNVNEKVGATMKNVMMGQLRDQNKTLGKRLCDFLPFYQKNLSSPNIKWESSYLKKKAEDLSTIYRNFYEGLRKSAEDCSKTNPPL